MALVPGRKPTPRTFCSIHPAFIAFRMASRLKKSRLNSTALSIHTSWSEEPNGTVAVPRSLIPFNATCKAMGAAGFLPFVLSARMEVSFSTLTCFESTGKAVKGKIGCMYRKSSSTSHKKLKTTPTKPATTCRTPSALSPEQKTFIETKRKEALAKKTQNEVSAREHAAYIAKAIAKDTSASSTKSEAAICKIPANDPLHLVFQELSNVYKKEGNYYASTTYCKVCDGLSTKLPRKMPSLYARANPRCPASADKMYELVTPGSIAKLEDKRAAVMKS